MLSQLSYIPTGPTRARTDRGESLAWAPLAATAHSLSGGTPADPTGTVKMGPKRMAERGSVEGSGLRGQAGRLNQIRVRPSADSAPTWPPVVSTSCFTMANPIPAPPRAGSRDFSTR